MPRVKKKIQECYFCQKRPHKIYHVDVENKQYLTCSDCQYFFTVLKEIVENDGKKLKKMVSVFPKFARHCNTCVHLNKSNPGYCYMDMYTGLSTEHADEYPNSYANQGCNYYSNLCGI